MAEFDTTLEAIIGTYNKVIRVVGSDAEVSERSTGGYIRSIEGKLQENITESLIRIAWANLNGDKSRLDISKKKVKIPIKKEYLKRIEDDEIRKYIESKMDDYYYLLSVDKHVYIDDNFVIGIECKAYTENAMLKRIIVDFSLLLRQYPNLDCYLLQLESQLTGDYSTLETPTFGSRSTHTILSYFDVDLKILTLLKGERKVNEPIHKKFKPLTLEQLQRVYCSIHKALSKFA